MKKTKYLVAALLLMGATTTFTSCIDNDEPAGITELRGAKAELLKAKAVVEQARAQYVLAQAEYQKALAAHEQANAEYRKAETAYMQAKADYAAAESAEKQAWAEKQMAQYKLDMEEAALKHQTTMVNLQNNLAVAQRNYELVLKQIEIAEAVMSDQDLVTVADLKAEAQKQFALIYGGTYQETVGKNTVTVHVVDEIKEGNTTTDTEKYVLSLVAQVENASNDYYKEMKNNVVSGNAASETFIPKLELDLELAEAGLSAANEKVAKLEGFLAEDVNTNDWRKEVEELEDSIAILHKEYSELLVQAQEVKASAEYQKAEQAYKGITSSGEIGNPDEDSKTVIETYKQKGTAQELYLAELELKTAKKKTELTIPAFKRELSDAEYELLKGINSIKVLLGDKSFQYGETKYYHTVDKDETPTELKGIVKGVETWVNEVSKYVVNDNTPESAVIALENAKKVAEAAAKAYKDDKVNWQIAVNANKGVATDVSTTEYDKAIKAYNDAYSALESKISDYNTTYDNVYNAAYSAKETELKSEKLNTEHVAAYETYFKTTINSDNRITEKAEATSAWNTSIKTVDAAIAIINKFAVATTDGDKQVTATANAAAIVAEVKDEADNAVNVFYADKHNKKDLEDACKAEAASKVASDNNVKTAYTAITTAETEVKTAYSNLSDALVEFETLANGVYAQVRTDDAKKVTFLKLTEGTVKDGSAWFDKEKNNGNPTGHYVAVRSSITPEEAASIIVTELDSDLAFAAWTATSATAFGSASNYSDEQNRAVEPTVNEIMDLIANSNGSLELDDFGSYGAKIEADNDVKMYEDLIEAKDMMAKLVEDLKKAQSDLAATILKNYTDNFSEEDKAVEDATAANEAAKAALEAEELKYELAALDADKVNLKAIALNQVKIELVAAIQTHLGITLVGDNNNPTQYDPESFTEQLQKTLEAAKREVVDAQANVELAKINLDQAQNGEFDAVALAKAKLDSLMAELKKAQANYDAILANIETALQIMAKTAE